MSIPITCTAEWFRCIGTAATLEERHAALYQLVRLLAGDASHRPPPQISLPGRPAAAPPPATAPAVPTVRYFRRALPRGKVINAPSKDSDGREPYSRRRLRRMDRSFVKRLERAITRGEEQPHAS
jgi:hypothetical protein